MKTKTILITLIAMLAITALVFQSCKKDDKEDPKPPIYTNGQGEIGEIGGTIKIDDPSSPINGASIVIPEGALKTTVEIRIEQPDSNYYINGSQNHLLIDIQPSGIQFEKPVTIGIPYNTIENEEYFKPFYYNPETEEIEELNPVQLDKQNKIYYAETMHTSFYFNDEMEMMIYWVKIDDNDITRIAAYTNILVDFDDLPTGWTYALSGYPNAYSILYSNYVPGVASTFVARLYKKQLFNSDLVSTKVMDVWINYCGPNDNKGKVVIDKIESGTTTTLFTKEYVTKRDIADDYMSGYPLLFIFDDFVPNTSDKYFVKVSWVLGKDYRNFTNIYTLGKKSDAEILSDMNYTTGDADLNGILDNYETGTGNDPPNIPTIEAPSLNATNISINTNLSWSCTDPEGDALDYDIYFGTSSNPPMVTDHHTSTTYGPGTLDANTTYYWKIKAFEVGNEDNQSASPVWYFTTGSGGGNDTENPVTYFIDPVSGETVSGNYPVIVRATDNVGIERVEIHVKENGVYQLECTIYDPYNNDDYSCNWNTGNYTNGNHWITVAAYDYAGNPGSTAIEVTVNNSGSNNPPTALFTVSPSSGTTSTNFAFDASGSTDNEDPTSNLQVRWDFDGNGSWDTGWDYDKTENHQYSSENTYTAKLEVKDTEGLTDIYTKSITVSNGGGTGTFTDPRDGQAYATVDIGSQTWFAENLNYETTNSWWYNNSSANGDVYGRLYTWEAALTACPSGWSLPSDDQWKQMEMALGMSQSEADDTGWRGTDEGGKMKETGTTHWNSPNTGATNTSGFTALPGGYRSSNGSFYDLGDYGYWWSSTEGSGTGAWARDLSCNNVQVRRYSSYKTYGFSVRCLKD